MAKVENEVATAAIYSYAPFNVSIFFLTADEKNASSNNNNDSVMKIKQKNQIAVNPNHNKKKECINNNMN